jgi:hypothetical protein
MLKPTTAIALLALPILSFAQTEAKLNPVQATFGRYGADCSSGRGACSFTVVKNDANSISKASSRKISENMIILQISRSAITKQEEIKIAGKPFSEFAANEMPAFIQQEDLYLNPETLQSLNIDLKYTRISAGNYPMTIEKDKIEVVFMLR